MKTRKRKLKTRNKLLLTVILLVIAYTITDIILGFVSAQDGTAAQLDSTLTEQVFSFAKWVVSTGCAITITKTIKGEGQPSPDDEPVG